MTFRLNALRATNDKPPGGNRGAIVFSTKRQLGAVKTELATPFSHSPGARARSAVP